MAPSLLFDLEAIDLNTSPVYDRDSISRVIPQRHEMQQLDGILWCNVESRLVLGYKDITDQEFWIRGHLPDRPLMPGVIMIECAAQLLSFFVKTFLNKGDAFIGFSGIESAKFRATVVPGNRLLLLGHIFEVKSRRYRCRVQGVVDQTLVFESDISGMLI